MLLTMFIVFTSICNAQDAKTKKTVEQKSTEMTEKLTEELQLTASQKASVKSINDSYVKNKRIIDDKIESLKKAKNELKKERNDRINEILTEEQRKKHEALKKKKKKK